MKYNKNELYPITLRPYQKNSYFSKVFRICRTGLKTSLFCTQSYIRCQKSIKMKKRNDPLFLPPFFIAYFYRLLLSPVFEHFGLIGFSPDYFAIKIFRVFI